MHLGIILHFWKHNWFSYNQGFQKGNVHETGLPIYCNFLLFFTHLKSSWSTTSREFAACSGWRGWRACLCGAALKIASRPGKNGKLDAFMHNWANPQKFENEFVCQVIEVQIAPSPPPGGIRATCKILIYAQMDQPTHVFIPSASVPVISPKL